MVHRAGPFENDLQRCDRCGYVLTDYRYYRNAITPALGWTVWTSIDVRTDGTNRYSEPTDAPPNCERYKGGVPLGPVR